MYLTDSKVGIVDILSKFYRFFPTGLSELAFKMYTGLKYLILFISISLALFVALQRIPNTNLAHPPSQQLSSTNDGVTTHQHKIEQMFKKAKFKRRWQLFCRTLSPDRKIQSMVHHKTGHDLSWQIHDVLQAFCHRGIRYETEFSINKLVNYCNIPFNQFIPIILIFLS